MNIKIIEKNTEISWDEITDVIHDAYKEREKQNLHFAATRSTPAENAQKILDGKCFLAMDNNEIAGLVFLRCPKWPYLTRKNGKQKWYCDKKYGMVINLAVKEKYKRHGISKKLLQKLIDECKDLKLDSVIIDTSSKLKWLNQFYASFGFKKVDYISWNTTNYYTIVRRLNLNGKEYNNCYRVIRYLLSKFYTVVTLNKYGQKRIKIENKDK